MPPPAPLSPADEAVPMRRPPLVHRVFGEPRFHTEGDVAALAFAADGTLWSVDESGALCRWSADGRLLVRFFLSDLETMWAFGPGAELLASGNDDLLMWEVTSGTLLYRLEQPSWVTALAFRPDGRVLASGHDDGSVRLWDVATLTPLGQVASGPGRPISAMTFDPRGDQLAVASEDRVIRVWDPAARKLVCELVSHTDRIPALAFSPDGRLLVSAGWDRSARVWRQPQTDPVMLLNSHSDQVHTLAFSPDGRYLACADSDHDIYLWTDPERAGLGPVLRGHTDDIRCLAFSPDGTRLASGGADRVIHVWDVREGKLLAGPNLKGRHSIAVVPGAALRLVSSAGSLVRVWDVTTGDEIPPTHLCPAYSVAASPDGRWLAVGGTDHFTQLWDVTEGRLVASLEATKPPIGYLTFSPDSRLLAHTSPADGLVWIWRCDTASPELILIEAADGCTLEGIAFHPDGRRIAVGGIDYLATGDGRDGAICLWDIPNKEKLYVLDTGVYALTFDPDGKYLAGAGLDEVIHVWDVDTREPVFALKGHSDRIHALVFSPDGSFLVSGGEDATVRVWDVLSGRLRVARELDTPVQSLAVSPDGAWLFCGNRNTTCYQIDFHKLIED